MESKKRTLLVEGESDRAFFEMVVRNLVLQHSVEVQAPKNSTGTHNTKQGVFNLLPTWLKQLADDKNARLGVVVDADTPPNGGYEHARDHISNIVAPFGYSLAVGLAGGLIYKHNDGLADFGLWVMPDNASHGRLEDWVKLCVLGTEQTLFKHAVAVVGALPEPRKFNPIQLSKAEVATWMAWQKKPGHGLYRAVEDGLIDTASPQYTALAAWLAHVFS